MRAVVAAGGCAFVRGPAGIGKTALLAQVQSPYRACGSELETAFTLGVVEQLLGRVPAHASFHDLYWEIADRCPAVLVVDDAHWLDPQSLRWLAFMVNRARDLPLAIVLAARDDEPSELLTRIALHDATTVIEPAPLSAAAVASLGGDEALWEASGGIPFYVHALLAGDARPVVDALALRLARLPPACTRLARALAVLDGAASGTVAARVARLDVRATVAAAELLARADILRGEAFAHPLVRAAVYEGIPAAERAELHMAAARLLRAPEHVAAQVMAAGPDGGPWAVEALRGAAGAAWTRGDPDAAARFLQRAAEEEMPREQRVGVLRELARALVACSGPDGLPVFREALTLAEPAERTELSLELGRALFAQGYFADACTALEAAAPDTEVELATVAALDLALVRRFGGLEAIAARAPASPIAAWIAVARRPPAADGAAQAEAALAGELSPSGRGAALVALMAAGELARAEAIWTAVAESARVAGALDEVRFAVVARAIVRLRMGRVAEVEADLRELMAWVSELQLPFAQYRNMLPLAVAPLVDALVARGALEEAARWPALANLEGAWPEEFGFTFLLDSLARLRLAQDRPAEALRLAHECGRRQLAWGIRNPGFVAWRSTLAAALAATGRVSEALDECDAQIAAARAFGVPREEGMALRVLGEITSDAATLGRAVAVLEASPDRLEHARALLAVGDREALRQALALAERCGASALAEQARRALIATGARPRRAATTGVAALTPSQLKVARLAAAGLGNRAIAERLFLTEKTVEGHLGAAYRKLGIGSRAQLADRLA